MLLTTNYGFKKPERSDHYDVNDFNGNFDIIDAELKSASDKANTATEHPNDTSNPHHTTAEQVGLGNVPNVATNDQTPTYTVASANAGLSSGEKLSVAFGKIAKAVASLISHLADTTAHITATERTAWGGKAEATHTHTKSQITDFPTTMTPAAHNQAASTITAGTFAGQVVAPAGTDYTTNRIRNAVFTTTEPTAGSASTYVNGTVVYVYE